MSSSSSLASAGAPVQALNTHRRRTTSISADAPTVITTDRIRPDWAVKLANARSHLARRSAAATALHTAAYLIGNGNNESRGFGFSSRRTFGRHRGGDSPAASGVVTPSSPAQENAGQSSSDQASQPPGQGGSSRRRSRIDDLEDMMMMEAIRLSLAAEDERKRKAEKEAAKEAKKKAKEEKKKEKKEKKIYGSGASSANGSTLSLSLPGLGRRRGNSGASNLAKEVTPETAEPSDSKGKGVDRSISGAATSAPMDVSRGESSTGHGFPGVRHLDTQTLTSIGDRQSSPSPTAPDKPSHLRQMSNASSPASSIMESNPGSLRNDFHTHGSSSTLDSPNASGTNLALHSGATPDGGDESGSAGMEPMFNFPSLAAMISNEEESEDSKNSSKHVEQVGHGSTEKIEDAKSTTGSSGLESSIATLRLDSSVNEANTETRYTTVVEPQISTTTQDATPEVMITPETPAAVENGGEEGKQLGSGWTGEIATREITQ